MPRVWVVNKRFLYDGQWFSQAYKVFSDFERAVAYCDSMNNKLDIDTVCYQVLWFDVH